MRLRERTETISGREYVRLKSGRLMTFWDAITATERAHTSLGRAISRAFLLADGDYDLRTLEWRIDHLEEHVFALRKYMAELRGVKTMEERIALLRQTEGRTSEEAAAYHAKADELERRLREKKS